MGGKLQDDRIETARDLLIRKGRVELIDFLLHRFREDHWTETLYRYLNGQFGHIAHFDSGGFFAQWFTVRPPCIACNRPLDVDDERWARYVVRDYRPPTGKLTQEEAWIRKTVILHMMWEDEP